MATDKLYSMLAFTGIPVGGTQTLAHGLQVGGVGPLVPDWIIPQFPDAFEVLSSDSIDITLRNTGSTSGDCNVMCHVIHPVERSFGLQPDDGNFTQGMVPRPFVLGSPNGGAGPFPVPVQEVEIFARLTGSDTTGDGTLANPYRTFFRALQDVPTENPILPGVHYTVDPTGIGVETLPRGFQFPVIQSPVLRYSYGQTVAFPYYFAVNGLTIRAAPQLFSGIPAGDAVINAGAGATLTTDPDTGLATITIAAPRASWAANGVRDRHLIRTAVGFQNSTCCIAGSDATHLFLCNTATRFNGGNGALVLAAGEVLQIVEPSVTLEAPDPPASSLGLGAITCANVSSINFQGIRFRCSDNPARTGLLITGTPNPFWELCVIERLLAVGVANQVSLHSTVLSGTVACVASVFTVFDSTIHDVATWSLDGQQEVFFDTDIRTSAPIANGVFVGLTPSPNWGLLNVHIDGSTGDGIRFQGSAQCDLANVSIENSAGHGILAQGNSTLVLATNVTGTGNTGAGIRVLDGGFVRVRDNATVITGVAGDMVVGTLPARTWADFRANVPVKNQYDLQTPFIVNVASGLATPGGDDVTGAGTGGCSGGRVFQRP
jgi:hypothetical protein